MNFNFTKEEEQFIDEVKSFIHEEKKKPNADDVFAPNREADAQTKIDSPARRDFMKILSSKGYLGMSWPKEYGGQEKPGIYDYILNEELCRVGAPSPGKGVGSIGQTIIHHGSNKIKDEFLPKILAGEIDFALGYSEPGAGSDLASLQLKAEKKNGGWLINGQKIWTSGSCSKTYDPANGVAVQQRIGTVESSGDFDVHIGCPIVANFDVGRDVRGITGVALHQRIAKGNGQTLSRARERKCQEKCSQKK